jgi:hypothetical protein
MSANPFERYPIANSLYTDLKDGLSGVGPFTEELKQTSAHFVVGKGAFLGVHPRSNLIIVNVVLTRALESVRVAKCEQVSKTRFHNEIKVHLSEEIDEELKGWIREAYQLKVAT